MSFIELLVTESMESRAKKTAMEDMWYYVKDTLKKFNKDRPEKASFKSQEIRNGIVYYFKEKGAHFWQEIALKAMDDDLLGKYKRYQQTFRDNSGASCVIYTSDGKDDTFSIATVIIQ